MFNVAALNTHNHLIHLLTQFVLFTNIVDECHTLSSCRSTCSNRWCFVWVHVQTFTSFDIVCYRCYLVYLYCGWLVWFMMFNTTFNNISAISWRSVLLVAETGENRPPVACHW